VQSKTIQMLISCIVVTVIFCKWHLRYVEGGICCKAELCASATLWPSGLLLLHLFSLLIKWIHLQLQGKILWKRSKSSRSL